MTEQHPSDQPQGSDQQGRHIPRPSLRTGLTGLALAASFAALAVALARGDSSEPAAGPSADQAPTLAATTASDDAGSDSQPVAGQETAAEAIYRQTAEGVVEVNASVSPNGGESPFGPGGEGQAQGTGFVIDSEGHIVTNEHVVDGASTVTVTFANGDEVPAEIVGTDPSTDTALLDVEVDASELHLLELGSSSDLVVGEDVFALGSPYGLDRSLTAGIVSALDRTIRAPNGYTITGAIQTDAAINSGNSGGPLLDAEGRVIGVTAQIESSTGGNVGIGYAIPIDLVEDVVAQLERGGSVQHAYLGVVIEELAGSEAESLGLEPGQGVRIAEVRDGSPAEQAGLAADDVIVAVDGQTIASPDALPALVTAKQPGEQIELEIVRDGAHQTLTATLGNRPEETSG